MRIELVRSLDHVILFVALEAMLRAKGAGDIEARRDQGIEAVRQVFRNRRRMSDQRDALSFERLAQFGVCQQAIDTVFHGFGGATNSVVKQVRS